MAPALYCRKPHGGCSKRIIIALFDSTFWHRVSPDWFFGNAELLAQRLLGCLLLRAMPDGEYLGGVITETEAYIESDSAAHSFRGKTKRNASVFLAAGHVYVYQIYGIHHCFNISAEEADMGAAVLIRAITLLPSMITPARPKNSCSGPGKLCKTMGITKKHDGLSLNDSKKPEFLLYAPRVQHYPEERNRKTSRRIGLSKNKHLFRRYYLHRDKA